MGTLHWIVGAGLLAAPAFAQNFEEKNTQRWGADYARFAMAEQTAEDCARACTADDRCRSWTFVKAGVEGRAAACHLKSAVPHGRPDPCCTSGVAKDSTPQNEMARIEPKARSAGSEPSGMTGATAGSDVLPGASFAPPAVDKAPALAPVSEPVNSPATSSPINLTPQSWDDRD